MIKKILYSGTIIIIITALAAAIIGYGRGYRINPWEKSIDSTGILSAASSPAGASIWINNKLKSATNASFSLSPGWYSLRIGKDGYQSWEKRIRIQGEVVTSLDALLIPSNPSLRALTVSGILSPALSPSGTRVAYIVPAEEATAGAVSKPRAGVWVFDLKNGPLGGISDPKQVYKPLDQIDWPNTGLMWSPDEKNLILTVKTKNSIIWAIEIFLDEPNTPAIAVTSTLDSIISDWQENKNLKRLQSFTTLPVTLSDFLKNAASDIQYSPDSSKILYLATSSATLLPVITPAVIGTNPTEEVRSVVPGKYYVYDVREDKNFAVADKKSLAAAPLWYTDSKRILMIENVSIMIIDYDGTNKRTVYSGPFAENLVYPWSSPGKLVILTNLNKPQALPNLYELDIQ